MARAYTAPNTESLIVVFLLGHDRLARLAHDASAASSHAWVMVVQAGARRSVEARVIERSNERHTTVILVGRSRAGVSGHGVESQVRRMTRGLMCRGRSCPAVGVAALAPSMGKREPL